MKISTAIATNNHSSSTSSNENESRILKDPQIDYLRRINLGGRFVVEQQQQQGGGRINDDDDDGGNNNNSIPLSLWPLILERAYKTGSGFYPNDENHKDTALHYLVREKGPNLFFDAVASNFVPSSSSSNNNNNNNNKKKRKQHPVSEVNVVDADTVSFSSNNNNNQKI